MKFKELIELKTLNIIVELKNGDIHKGLIIRHHFNDDDGRDEIDWFHLMEEHRLLKIYSKDIKSIKKNI